jgi:5-methylcytosine-specific restriction endonuclease McrA
MSRKRINASLRENVWILYNGRKFDSKCAVSWCNTLITVFDFECGHNVAHATGGKTDISNLRPICPKCNKSMGTMSIDEFSEQVERGKKYSKLWECFKYDNPRNE